MTDWKIPDEGPIPEHVRDALVFAFGLNSGIGDHWSYAVYKSWNTHVPTFRGPVSPETAALGYLNARIDAIYQIQRKVMDDEYGRWYDEGGHWYEKARNEWENHRTEQALDELDE